MAHAHSSSMPDRECLQASSHQHQPDYSDATNNRGTFTTAVLEQQLNVKQGHARRLQLRHTGFGSAVVHSSSRGCRQRALSQSQQVEQAADTTIEPTVQDWPHECSRQHSSSNSVSRSILQEIKNHAFVTRSPNGISQPSLFNLSPDDASPPFSMTTNDENVDSEQRLHGLFVNDSVTPPSPKLDRHGNARGSRGRRSSKALRRSRASSRSEGSETGKYIEHLESELASMTAKLDALASPSVAKAQAVKIRALNKQTQSLREEVKEWENKFEDRVKEQAFESIHHGASLKARISELEEEAETKDLQSTELQHELESIRKKLSTSEALEAGLSRRIEVLTSLLAQSPTRSSFAHESPTTPSVNDARQRRRPVSLILPSVRPISYDYRHLNSHSPAQSKKVSTESNETSPRPIELLDSPVSRTQYPLSHELLEACSREKIDPYTCTDPNSVVKALHDSALSESSTAMSDPFSVYSGPSTSSRPTSIMSNSSIWSAWGVSSSSDVQSKPEHKSRRMRRFMSGSTSLKPLLLPTTTPGTDPQDSVDCGYISTARDISSNFADYSPCSPSASSSTPNTKQKRSSELYASLNPNETHENYDHYDDNSYWRLTSLEQTPLATTYPPQSQTIISSPLLVTDSVQDISSNIETTPRDCAQERNKAQRATQGSAQSLRFIIPDTNLDAVLMEDSSAINQDLNQHGEEHEATEFANLNDSRGHYSKDQSSLLQYTSRYSIGYAERMLQLVTALRRRTLVRMRHILVRCWAGGSCAFSALGWWLFGLVCCPRQAVPSNHIRDLKRSQPYTLHQRHMSLGLSSPALVSSNEEPYVGNFRSVRPTSNTINATLGYNHYSRSIRTCSTCVEPALRRNLRIWCKFSLTLVLAIGIAIVEGPENLLIEHDNSAPHIDEPLNLERKQQVR